MARPEPDAAAGPRDFAAALATLLGRPLGSTEPLAVAISGGPDSLALLLLAHAAFPGQVRALTVDHGLRPESAAEAHAVAALCATRGIPHATLVWTGDKPAANRQAAARRARYRLMAGWCRANAVAWLATAHHADDQAETLLMRLARGSGTGGLSGIRPVRPLGDGVTLLRPLLARRKADLAAIVLAAGVSPVDDPSNRDPRHDRARLRRRLEGTRWLNPARLAASAAHLAEAEAALAWTSDFAWAGRATVADDGIALDAAGLPAEIVRRLVLRALAELTPGTAPSGPAVSRLLVTLAEGRAATLAGIAARGGDRWTFRRAPPRATPDCAKP